MKNIPTFEQFVNESIINEGYLSPKDANKLRIGSVIKTKSETYTIIAYGQKTNATRDLAAENEKGDKFNLRVSLKGASGISVASGNSLNFNETPEMLESLQIDEALSAASIDKLTIREPLTPKVNATLISNARNGILKSMKEPEGKTHYWNPKTKEYVALVRTYNGKGEYWHTTGIDGGGNLMESTLNEGWFDDYIRDIHFEINPDKQLQLKKAYGKKTGAMSNSSQISSADYALAKFRREIKYDNGSAGPKGSTDVFIPNSSMAVFSTLGNGPHAKKQKAHSWNKKLYDKWVNGMSGNGGAENAYDMAQNAKFEPGLLDWVKKNLCNDETPLERIQWDIEAYS